jgi:O-antigen/teichoic acid export membrane protein
MNTDIARSITKNTAVMMGSQAITWVSSFILMLFLPRYLGSAEYGRLYLAMSIAAIFQVFIEFGGFFYITKYVARDREKTPYILADIETLRFILWVVSLLLMAGFASVANYSSSVNLLLFIFGISKLWETLTALFQRCFQGAEVMQYAAVGNIAERVFVTVASITALFMGAPIVVIGIIMAVSTLVNYLISRRLLPRIITFRPKADRSRIKLIVKESVPYFLWTLFGIVYYRVDAVMLSFLTPAVVVGWYGAAYRFFDIVMFLPNIFNMAVFPVFSRLWSKENAVLARTTKKSIDFILLTGIPISIGLLAFAKEIVGLFYGLEQYGPTADMLKIFSVGILLVYIDFIILPLLIASDQQRRATLFGFFAMLLNPILNWFFIPYFQSHYGNGGIGATLATLVTEYFILTCAVLSLPKHVFSENSFPILLKGIIAGVGMVGFIALLKNYNIFWIVNGAGAMLVYFAIVIVIRAVEPDELRLIMQNLKFYGRNKLATAPVEG